MKFDQFHAPRPTPHKEAIQEPSGLVFELVLALVLVLVLAWDWLSHYLPAILLGLLYALITTATAAIIIHHLSL